MKIVEKAIWYIESHCSDSISLDELADVTGSSRYHLSRAFSYRIGVPISRYLRGRRLSLAAQELAAGKNDILDLALSLGYNSHEAFSRAFKQWFGQTPEGIRALGHTRNLNLLEATRMQSTSLIKLAEPDIVKQSAMLLAGLSCRYAAGNNAEIPRQWQAFGAQMADIPGRIEADAFGVVYNMDDEDAFEYLTGVEVVGFEDVPADFTRLRLEKLNYAVFRHDGHVSAVQATCHVIWNEWLPNSGQRPASQPFFERYPADFNSATGEGGFEIWLPIEG